MGQLQKKCFSDYFAFLVVVERKFLIQKENQRKFLLKKNLKKLYEKEGIVAEKNDVKLAGGLGDGESAKAAKSIAKGGIKNEKGLSKAKKSSNLKRNSPFQKTASSIEKKREIKKKEVQERQRQKEEKEESRKRSLVERKEARIQLSKRTKKGQPVMANTINHLLSKLLR